jgi:hypothetical protein
VRERRRAERRGDEKGWNGKEELKYEIGIYERDESGGYGKKSRTRGEGSL